MSIFATNKSNIKNIWSISIQLYKKSFFKVWALVAISSVGLIISFLIDAMHKANGTNLNTITSATVSVTIFLVNIYLTSLVLLKIYNTGYNKKESWKTLLSFINKKYLKITASMFIVIISYLLGLVALILPGIFLFILLAMVQPLVLFDDHGVMAALKGSCKLVWGNWWHTFAILFPLLLISYWISFSTGYAASHHKWYLLGINLILGIFLYPFFYSCLVTIFKDLKIRKDQQQKVTA